MFWRKTVNELEKEVLSLGGNISKLEAEKRILKEEVADLKLKKKMEEEDIKHMIKIDRERKDIEVEKEKIEVNRKANDAIAEVKDKYRDKVETQLHEQAKEMKSIYTSILGRLPNYNVNHKVNENK